VTAKCELHSDQVHVLSPPKKQLLNNSINANDNTDIAVTIPLMNVKQCQPASDRVKIALVTAAKFLTSITIRELSG